VKEKWNQPEDINSVKKDTIVSIALGGLVSMAIIISAASINSDTIANVSDLAKGLEPLYGAFAKYFLAIGLFAAGITSAITAPLAAAYVAKGCLGWKGNLKSKNFRGVWIFILVLGIIFSSLGVKPIEIIKVAQVANGLLLPLIAGILLWVMNKESVLGKFKNTKTQNFIGLCLLVFTIFLGLKSILKVLNVY
jgi:manganese transport protein